MASWQLPRNALIALTQRENVGNLHPTLKPEPLWLPPAERDEHRRALDNALHGAGILDRRGRVITDVLDLLPLLTNAAMEFFGWFTRADATVGALAATRGLQGVLAVREGDTVTITPIHRDRLAEALVEQLPELWAGGGRPMALPVTTIEASGRTGVVDTARNPDLDDLGKIRERPVNGSGELYVGERDSRGNHRQLVNPLHYVDTDWGRYLNYTTGTGNDATLHLAPATPATLAATLHNLRSTLPAPART